MYYHVILTRNGEHKKTIKSYKKKGNAMSVYRSLKKQSDRVQFPKKYVNYNKIFPVEYKLYVVKDREEGDKDPHIRDEMGRVKKHEPLYGKYTVINYTPYYVEEMFWVFGFDKTNERKTIKDIYKLLTEDIGPKSKIVRNVIVVHNKVLIYDEDHFEMVICKCKKDAQRLQYELRERTTGKKMYKKNILFLGIASGTTVGKMYDLIQEETGWPMKKIRRRSTKP